MTVSMILEVAEDDDDDATTQPNHKVSVSSDCQVLSLVFIVRYTGCIHESNLNTKITAPVKGERDEDVRKEEPHYEAFASEQAKQAATI